MFLTPDEISELTGSQPQSVSYQCKWLDRHGFPFELSAAGQPKVLRAYVERRFGLASSVQKSESGPDFSQWEQQ
jgi:hypothetical protein